MRYQKEKDKQEFSLPRISISFSKRHCLPPLHSSQPHRDLAEPCQENQSQPMTERSPRHILKLLNKMQQNPRDRKKSRYLKPDDDIWQLKAQKKKMNKRLNKKQKSEQKIIRQQNIIKQQKIQKKDKQVKLIQQISKLPRLRMSKVLGKSQIMQHLSFSMLNEPITGWQR